VAQRAESQAAQLEVQNLTTSVRRQGRWIPVVRDISFSIGFNETLALVGESGSGKSITAMSIMRLLQASDWKYEGRIALEGNDLLALPESGMQRVRGNEVAMVFQEPMTSLNPIVPIGVQISEALRQHRNLTRAQSRKATIELLEKVRIPAAAMRYRDYPHHLSGGMRQRVMIAMALACKPKLLIADEPTTALDVTTQAQILDLIKVLQQEEGMSVLFITHDMGVVAEIADRMLVMFDGRIVEAGSTRDVFAAPRDAYTRSLLAAVPRLGSMKDHANPQRFGLVDRETGVAAAATEILNTVKADGPPVLEVKGLSKRYDVRSGLLRRVSGRVHAVEDVSFALHEGETLALVGESGSGKSTTGRAILRLIEPDEGSVKVDGVDLADLDRSALRAMRRRMQIVFQDPFASLNPRVKVGESIAAPLLAHGVGTSAQVRDKVGSLLDQVGLSARMADRYPREFSGGQRQRICIARALALNPKLIVADEAVSALDVSIKAQVVNLFLDLQERLGIAYLFISHDIAVVERLSHRVAVMYLGEIVEIGPRAAIFGDPRHPYTRMLMQAVPIPDPTRQRRPRPEAKDRLRNALRPLAYERTTRARIEVSPEHFVQEWDEAEWPL
jgi:peptide/nickel transport system ATP-binding protein